MADFWVSGVVSVRDKRPYVQLANKEGLIGQFTLPEARAVAWDILQMAARTEADAMLWKFCQSEGIPEAAGTAMMRSFRDYRAELDQETVERLDPDAGGS